MISHFEFLEIIIIIIIIMNVYKFAGKFMLLEPISITMSYFYKSTKDIYKVHPTPWASPNHL